MAPGVAAALVGSRANLTRASNKMQLPIKCIILGSEAVTHRQKDLENPQGSSKDIETHVYCNPVYSFSVFVAFSAHIRSPLLPDVAQYTLVILVVLALRNFTLLLRRLVPPNWLYHKESLLLENYFRAVAEVCRRAPPPPQLAATAAVQWLCREKLRSFPSVRVRSCLRSYVRFYVYASKREAERRTTARRGGK